MILAMFHILLVPLCSNSISNPGCHCFKGNSLYYLIAFVPYLPLIKSLFYGFINVPALVPIKGTHKDLANISLLRNKDITVSEDLD